MEAARRASPPIALGYGIGRIGCLLNGCCWGKQSDLPWPLAIQFPAGSIPFEHQVERLYATQLYLAAQGLVLLAVTLLYYWRRRQPGEVMAVLMVGYAITRFLLEYLRGDVARHWNTLTISQIISIPLLAGGLLTWWWLRRRLAMSAPLAARA